MVKVKNMCQAKTPKEIRLLNYSIMGESSIPAAQLKAGLHPAETLSSINKIPSYLRHIENNSPTSLTLN